MASRLGDIVPKSESGADESLVHPGYQITFSGGSVESDLQQLEFLLKSVADCGGKMVISFPGSTHAQVKEYADQFKTAKQCKQTRATTCFSMCHRSTDADLDDECQEVSIIGVLITNTLQYAQMIKGIFTSPSVRQSLPNISLVLLLRFISSDEALTVRTVDPIGQVYFKTFASNLDLDDTSQFFRVGFFLNQSDYVIILISLQYLLPVGVKPNTNDLYAILPQSPINPPDPDPPSNPFHWLPPILNNPGNYQSVLFRQNGTNSRAVIYPSNGTVDTRVSRGEGSGSPAIIANSDLEFFVDEIYTY